MERLTMNNGLCKMASTEFCLSQKDCYSCPHGRKRFKRLAAYEKTMPLERAQELAQAEKDGRLLAMQHGRWIPFHSEAAGDIQYCSKCEIGFAGMVDFCPHCGAKMDKGADNETD